MEQKIDKNITSDKICYVNFTVDFKNSGFSYKKPPLFISTLFLKRSLEKTIHEEVTKSTSREPRSSGQEIYIADQSIGDTKERIANTSII